MVKLKDLIDHLDKLPRKIEFEASGVEFYHEEIMYKELETHEDMVRYIKALKERIRKQSLIIEKLADAYNGLINWIRELEIDTFTKEEE